MDAGRAFNTFPLMAGRWIPEDYFSESLPVIRNFFENTAAVQWDHRVLATTTLASVGTAWLWMRTLPVPPRAMMAMHIVAGVTATQVCVGWGGCLRASRPGVSRHNPATTQQGSATTILQQSNNNKEQGCCDGSLRLSS